MGRGGLQVRRYSKGWVGKRRLCRETHLEARTWITVPGQRRGLSAAARILTRGAGRQGPGGKPAPPYTELHSKGYFM